MINKTKLINQYAKLLTEYNKAHCNDRGFIPDTMKAHNPYLPSSDVTLNALMKFEGDLCRKVNFKDARYMKVEAINKNRGTL